MEATIYSRIDEFQNKTFEVVTDQEVLMTEEDQMNSVLDHINLLRERMNNLLPFFQNLLDEIVTEIPNRSKRELIYLRNKLDSLSNTTKKFTQNMVKIPYANAFNSLILEYKVLNSDLREIISDIDKKVKGNKEIDNLLNDLAGF